MRLVERDGTVVADPAARLPGRGAYICPDRRCLERAAAQGGLRRALRARVTVAPDLLDLDAA